MSVGTTNERLERTIWNVPCYCSVFCISFPRLAQVLFTTDHLVYYLFPIATTPLPQVPFDGGAGRYKPLTPTTLIPSSLARTNLIGDMFSARLCHSCLCSSRNWGGKFSHPPRISMGRDSSVGIATALRAERSGDRIPVGGEIFRSRSLLYNGYRIFPGGKAARAWR